MAEDSKTGSSSGNVAQASKVTIKVASGSVDLKMWSAPGWAAVREVASSEATNSPSANTNTIKK